MQYIEKKPIEPANWGTFFINVHGGRSYLYKDYKNYPSLLQLLINEQHHLCAYCQASIDIKTASIEHFIPQSQNDHLSTSYHNLFAVCKDRQGKGFCEEVRGNIILPPIVYHLDAQETNEKNHFCFIAFSDGTISASGKEYEKFQADIFLKILKLNEYSPKSNREKVFKEKIDNTANKLSPIDKMNFYRSQFHKISHDKAQPYRQFILMALKQKMIRKIK